MTESAKVIETAARPWGEGAYRFLTPCCRAGLVVPRSEFDIQWLRHGDLIWIECGRYFDLTRNRRHPGCGREYGIEPVYNRDRIISFRWHPESELL